MSANDAKPTGEVKNPDEPYFGDEGVNYDTYADDSNISGPEKTDINFDSADIDKRQKTEYFVNVAGAEKRKREEERQAKKSAERRMKLLKKQKEDVNDRPIAQSEDDVKSLVRKRRRESFAKKYLKKILIISAIVIVVVTAGIIGTATVVKNVSEGIKNDNIAKSYGDVFKEIEVIRSRYGKNTDDYFNAMQELIDGSEYDETKARILLYRAEDLSQFDDKELLKKALADAYKSEELVPTIDSAYWVSVIEKKLGNEEKFKEYEDIKNRRVGENKIEGQG